MRAHTLQLWTLKVLRTLIPWFGRSRWALPLAVFLLAGGISTLIIHQQLRSQRQHERQEAHTIARDHANATQQYIERSMSVLHALAALVQERRGSIDNFDQIATLMLPASPGVSVLILAPGGVITHAVPLPGNEKALGVNLLDDPVMQAEARLTRDSARLTLAGPVELKQGGLGLVARLPIYLDGPTGKPEFWGFTNAVMRFPQALRAAHLPDLQQHELDYKLSRVDLETGRIQAIHESSAALLIDPVEVSFPVPNGAWTLKVAPIHGWGDQKSLLKMMLIGLLCTTLLAYSSAMLQRQLQHRQDLEAQVAQRTADIQASQNQLQATLAAIPDQLFEMDLGGHYLRCHTPRAELLAAPVNDLLGKTVANVLPQKAAEVVSIALQAAHRHGLSRGHQFELNLRGSAHWFELSIASKPVPQGEASRFIMVVHDITERKRAELALHEERALFTGGPVCLFIWRAAPDWPVEYVSDNVQSILGYTPEAMKDPGFRFSQLIHPQDLEQTQMQIQHAIENRVEQFEQSYRLLHKDGSYRWFYDLSRPTYTDKGGLLHLHGYIFDQSRLKEAEESVEKMAYFDTLTGLPNRALLNDRINHALNEAARRKETLALMFLDLDHFKNINDTLGHRVGDAVLVALSQRMLASVREQDTVARLGGDEFILLLPDTGARGAARVAQKLLQAISMPIQVANYDLTVTPSMGIAQYPVDGTDLETLSRHADIAMYRAKRGGRNSYQFFTTEMQQHSARALELDNALRRALERRQFSLHYQPQLSLRSGEVVGVEALLRWKHPDLGEISPSEFIPVAEGSGQILRIGEWVLRTAIDQARHWLDQGFPEMMLSVNLSAVQFRHPDLPDLVAQALHESQLPAHLLELELTESVAQDDPMKAIAVMDKLRSTGVRMSIDDFGTGFSSLNYLKRFNAYKIKIDKSFVNSITVDADDCAIVSAIINMARSLGMQTIAEGVESDTQLALLRELGCDEIQGYFFSRPLPPEKISEFLSEQRNAA